MMSTPIYLQVCEDLHVYPLAMRLRTHETFMREHGQAEWLAKAIDSAYTYDRVILPTRLKRPTRPRNKRR
jgi:hypothetical protein